eukprot:CAMPEP_0183366244 /NCGR_PEP_ID=MMETSP0164_2-20130417/87925_1 /TAXON_ID=221442 /ORGANISM="Coccolithus pelagicus ssp braarudi, Strain PLY182g" /LENGTH=58 /DNA_ID=CAMNT_0025541937 /DNA_START=125 /DNA_END=298 /DNA_ORIENTATION=+
MSLTDRDEHVVSLGDYPRHSGPTASGRGQGCVPTNLPAARAMRLSRPARGHRRAWTCP